MITTQETAGQPLTLSPPALLRVYSADAPPLCDHHETELGSELWICQTCGHKAYTNHPPGKRICGNPPAPTPAAKPNFHSSTFPLSPSACTHRGELLRLATCKPCQAAGNTQQIPVHACALHGECTASATAMRRGDIATAPRIQGCATCPDRQPALTTDNRQPTTDYEVIPQPGGHNSWEGISQPKPWAYDVTAIIPVIEPDKSLELVIELLRLQTERPYILLIDTGSSPTIQKCLESLRAHDLEIHYIRKHGARHPSELVSMALDVGVALSPSRFNFFTHSDCFLRKRTALAELQELAAEHIVAGHQITERPYAGWEQEFGHTLLMVDQPELYRAGVTWSMRNWAATNGLEDYGSRDLEPNYVDTERGFNKRLDAAWIKGHFTGRETNYQRNKDAWIDHVRSAASSKIYHARHAAACQEWMQSAIQEARDRIALWRSAP